jgi:hypothetical protein
MWGDALCDLADVVRRQAGTAPARLLLEEALDLYRRKQHLVAIGRTEDLLAALAR